MEKGEHDEQAVPLSYWDGKMQPNGGDSLSVHSELRSPVLDIPPSVSTGFLDFIYLSFSLLPCSSKIEHIAFTGG